MLVACLLACLLDSRAEGVVICMFVCAYYLQYAYQGIWAMCVLGEGSSDPPLFSGW